MQMGSDRVIEVQPCMIASTHSYMGVKALTLCPAAIALPVFSILHAYLWKHVNGFTGGGVVVTSSVENMESFEQSFWKAVKLFSSRA